MNIKETIRKVLREVEEEWSERDYVDLSKQIRRVTDEFLELNDPDKKFICSYELSAPTFKGVFAYKMFIHFNVGPKSINWPRTQAVHLKEMGIMEDIQDFILNYIGVYVQMWSKPSSC